MEYKDYYKILGVSRDAKEDEIKRVYRKLARKFHPDVSKEPNAEERFKEVQEAYEVLKDPKKREAYNQLGANWKAGQDFRPPPNWHTDFEGAGFGEEFGGFSDFFSSIFGGRAQGGRSGRAGAGFQQRGNDEQAKIRISLLEAFRGGSKQIQLSSVQSDRYGQQHQQTHTLKVNIPPGILSGQKLRLAKQGSPGIGNGPPGDLFLEVEVAPDHLFKLEGRDVCVTLPIAPWEAALGATVTVPTLGGSVEMKIAAGAEAGQKMRLKGRGMPNKTTPGDQYVVLQIVLPPIKTDADRELYKKMAEMMPFDPRRHLS